MSSFALTLPKQYPLVLLVSSSFSLLQIFQFAWVMKARLKAKIKYPQPYATEEQAEKDPDARDFNCAVRAHVNTLEALPIVIPSILLSGVKYPRFAIGTGLVWIVARVFYTVNYRGHNPAARLKGIGWLVAPVGFLTAFGATWTAGLIAYESLA